MVLSAQQKATLAVWYQVNTSLSAYHKLIQHFQQIETALSASSSQWQSLGIHKSHLQRHDNQQDTQVFLDKIQQDLANQYYGIIFYDDPNYPQMLKHIYDPPPLLFYKGNPTRLNEAQISIVGSRKPTSHAQKITFDMAQYLAQQGYIITSGLAQGVDKQAHLGALAQPNPNQQGLTIGVMGTGIDVCYPKHHEDLFGQIINSGGCVISELLPQTPATKHTFPRRNRLVAGLGLGTIVTEATIQSGSLITARLTSELGKQVFAIPSHIDNPNAEGCHHLIREGATLIYHPEQIIDDLKHQNYYPKTFSSYSTTQTENKLKTPQPSNLLNTAIQTDNQPNFVEKTSIQTIIQTPPQMPKTTNINYKKSQIDIPKHLITLYEQIDWAGQDLDSLVIKTGIQPSILLGLLMELELLGVITQMAGIYTRI